MPDTINVIDAAEDVSALRASFTFTDTGDNTIVSPPGGQALRLRRLMPTMSDPDGDANPLLTLKLGAVEVARGYVLAGRFDVTGAADAALILNLSKPGSVSGTAFYEIA